MKIKVLSLIISIIMAAGALAGCGGAGKPEATVAPVTISKDYNVDELARSIYTDCEFEDSSLAEIEDKNFILTFYGIDSGSVAEKDGVKQAAAYVASATPEMIIVVRAANASSVSAVYDSAIKPFIDNYIEGYSDYGPEQVPKLKSAVVHMQGEYLIVVISANNTEARSYVGGLMG